MGKYLDYSPETVGEEYAYLAGRLDAFAIFLKNAGSVVETAKCAEMLGIKLEREEAF